MPIVWTPEEIEKLKKRALAPKETEYQSAAGKRRSENPDLDQILKVLNQAASTANPGPTFRRVGHRRGFGRGQGNR